MGTCATSYGNCKANVGLGLGLGFSTQLQSSKDPS